MSATFDDARDLYQRVIMDRGRAPHHMRRLDPFDASAKGDNPMCGDRVEVRLRCEAGHVAEVAFEARGCAISVASADLMVEAATGRTPAELRDIAARFGSMVATGACPDCGEPMDSLRPLSSVSAYRSRIRCATLPWDALLQALETNGYE